VFGPRQNPKGPYAAVIPLFIDHLLKSVRPQIFGDGEQSRDFTYVSNVVYANLLAAFNETTPGFDVYNIGCGGTTSVTTLFNIIKSITGGKVEAIYEAERPGDIRDSSASIDKAEKILGYKPLTEIEQGLKETATWFKENKNAFA